MTPWPPPHWEQKSVQVEAWRQKFHDELCACGIEHGGEDGILDSLEACPIGRYMLGYEKAVLAVGEVLHPEDWGQRFRNRGSQVRVGDVIRMTSFRDHIVTDEGEPVRVTMRSYRANPRRVYVAIMLGTEALDGSEPLDPEAALRRMGWVKQSEVENT